MNKKTKPKRSVVIHDFMRGWGRYPIGRPNDVVFSSELPRLFARSELSLRFAIWRRKLWRRLRQKFFPKRKTDAGGYRAEKFEVVMSKITSAEYTGKLPDIRKIITENALRDLRPEGQPGDQVMSKAVRDLCGCYICAMEREMYPETRGHCVHCFCFVEGDPTHCTHCNSIL